MNNSSLGIAQVATLVGMLTVCALCVMFMICAFTGWCREAGRNQIAILVSLSGRQALRSQIGSDRILSQKIELASLGTGANVVPIEAGWVSPPEFIAIGRTPKCMALI